MKKSKIITSLVIISLVLCTAIPVFASSTISRQSIYLQYSNTSASNCDSYVTAVNTGTIHEDHLVSYASPLTFKANLEFRTAWYKPNDVRDTSYTANGGWNQSSCNAGEQYRTYVYVTGYDGTYTYEDTNYTN
ncbi:hypothetical protein [Candidatus Clostridium radicumherbarum]|uniref:Uncharacterized protein n=1 Tax=Candidatus Clostridium radicumherbarum TaxID=3381662 RepID=A0ABW8TPC5_9CLOT